MQWRVFNDKVEGDEVVYPVMGERMERYDSLRVYRGWRSVAKIELGIVYIQIVRIHTLYKIRQYFLPNLALPFPIFLLCKDCL